METSEYETNMNMDATTYKKVNITWHFGFVNANTHYILASSKRFILGALRLGGHFDQLNNEMNETTQLPSQCGTAEEVDCFEEEWGRLL